MLNLIKRIKSLSYFDDTDKNFEKKDKKLKSKYNRKIIFYLSDIDETDVIKSHDETRQVLDHVLEHKLKNVLIRTYSVADISFCLSDPCYDHHYDIYISRLYDGEKRPRYLKLYPHMKALARDLRYHDSLKNLLLGGTFDHALKISNEIVDTNNMHRLI